MFLILFISLFVYINNVSSFKKIKEKIMETNKIILSPNSDDAVIKREITDEKDIKEIIRILSNIEQSNIEIVAGVGSSYRLTLYDENYKKLLAIECIPDLSILNKSYSIKINKEDLKKLTEIVMKYDLKYYYDTYIKDV